MSNSKALYAFSADPFTNGHLNVVERISKTFEEVVVAIGKNPSKKYMFDLDERLTLARKSLSHLNNVRVMSFSGMVVDFACSMGVKVIVKGVRNSADFDYEQMLHQVGESQEMGIDTHILFADPKLAHVSSSTVKGIQFEHGDIQSYVSLPVKSALEQRVSNQIIVGVTGSVACGKSTISNELVLAGEDLGVDVHDIDLDVLGHQIFSDLSIPLHKHTTEKLIERHGQSIEKDGYINRKALAEIVFSNKSELDYLNALMKKPLAILLRRTLQGKEGIILLNGALLVEAGYMSDCNNHLVVIDVDRKAQESRMIHRGLNIEQIEQRLSSQKSSSDKILLAKEKIDQDNFGNVWRIDTSKSSPKELATDCLTKLMDYFHHE